MWRTYFTRSRIYGIDIYDKRPHDERRIKTFKGSQVDEPFLAEVVRAIGQIDIIVDDGSHLNEHVLQTFHFLFPRLAPNGMYVIEDTQTSYWQSYGGSSECLNRADTIIGFLKGRIDGLNHVELETPGRPPSYYDRNIVALHFYHNLVFVQKGANTEASTNR
jgi:hypothetical protein